MIFSTQHQLNVTLIFIFGGIIAGICSSFLAVVFLKKYQKNLIKNIFSSIFYMFFSVFFVFLLNFYNFGKFSFVLTCVYVFAFTLIKNLSKNLVVILQDSWYNTIVRTKKNRSHRKIKGEKINWQKWNHKWKLKPLFCSPSQF